MHAPNVAKEFQAKGGLRYAITLTDQNRATHPFLGIAELLYCDRASAKRHLSEVVADPFMALTTAKLLQGFELIGIA